MNFEELKSGIKYLKKSCPCTTCNVCSKKDESYKVIATTRNEALIEILCEKCEVPGLVTVVFGPENEILESVNYREHRAISQNDVLDVKNFLNNFDGDFKKIFKK